MCSLSRTSCLESQKHTGDSLLFNCQLPTSVSHASNNIHNSWIMVMKTRVLFLFVMISNLLLHRKPDTNLNWIFHCKATNRLLFYTLIIQHPIFEGSSLMLQMTCKTCSFAFCNSINKHIWLKHLGRRPEKEVSSLNDCPKATDGEATSSGIKAKQLFIPSYAFSINIHFYMAEPS